MSVRLSENEIKLVNNVSQSLYKSFRDVSGLDENEKTVILFFLTLKKEGFSSDFLGESSSTELRIKDFLYTLNPEYRKSYLEILKFYLPIIKKIPNHDVFFMFKRWESLANSIGPEFLSKNFLEIFETISSYYNVFDSGSIFPKELSRLISNIVPVQTGSKIFNPHAGAANIARFIEDDIIYYGLESDLLRYVIGKLQLLAIGYSQNKKLEYGNVEERWTPYDVIITDPFSVPPKAMLKHREKNSGKGMLHVMPFISVVAGALLTSYISFATSKEINQNLNKFLKKGLNELKVSGKLVLIVPNSFLYDNSNLSYRKKLIDKDFIASVISLPPNILKFTGVEISILLIDKKKNKKGIINFIDGSNFVSDSHITGKKLKDYELNEVIKLDQKSSIFRKVKNEKIRRFNYILDFKRYALKAYSGTPLNEVLTRVGLSKELTKSDGTTIKLIKAKDLKEDKVDFNLATNSLEASSHNRSLRKLEESALLISLENNKLRPTYFDYAGVPVYLGVNIVPLKVNKSKIVVDYLINELLSDDVHSQVEGLSIGSSTPILRVEDFLKIKIKITSISQQHLIVEKLRTSILQQKVKESSLEKQLIDVKKIFQTELGEKQHSMRQYLANVTNAISLIRTIMDRNGGVLKADDMVSLKNKTFVSDILKSLNSSLQALKIEVTNLQIEDKFESPIPVDLENLISEAINNFENKSSNYRINYEFDKIKFELENIESVSVLGSEKSIREMLNNIFENAVKHGFRDKKNAYVILVKLSVEKSKIVLQILNNGRPFPIGLKENLGVKGQKAGETGNTGIGIWKVFEIAKHYNFEYRIIDKPDTDYPVGWEFKFNII